MKITCANCHQSIEINPAAMLGRVKTEAKSEASRINGKKGGRPKVVKLEKGDVKFLPR